MANTFEIGPAVADVKIERRIINRQKSISDRELLIAANLGDVTKVNELIENGADCNFKDKDGNTALFYAIESSANEDKKIQVVELLLRKGSIISFENAKCETPLDLAYKSKAQSIVTLLETQLVENSFKALEKIILQNHSYASAKENLPEPKKITTKEKVKQKVEVCLNALIELIDNKESKKFTYKNANVFLLFLEAFALQDVEIFKENKNELIESYFGKEDNEVIKSVRDILLHRDSKKKEIIEPAYLQNIVPEKYVNKKTVDVSKFFCDLKDYVQWVYDKFCKKQNNDSRKLPIRESTKKPNVQKDKSLLDVLLTLVKKAYSVEQDQDKQEQVMFNLIVNILPLLETDFRDGDLKTLKNLRNELVHNFHKYRENMNFRLMELMSSLNELSSTLLAYYYAQLVFKVFENMKPGEDSKKTETKIDEQLTSFLYPNDKEGLVTFLSKAKGALGYKFSETHFPDKGDADILKLVHQYLKFMVIIDGTKIQKEEELVEKEKLKVKKPYKLLSDVKRRHIFEMFLMLKTIQDLDYKEYYQEKKEELIQELSDYGIESDTVNSVCGKYVQNDEKFDDDEMKDKVTSIVKALNSFSAQIPSVQDIISIYRSGSKEIDKLNVDNRAKQVIKESLDGLPEDQNVDIQVNGDEFRIRISEIVINIFETFNYAYNKYQLKFTNEDAFNNKIFLDFLASKSIERDISQGSRNWRFRDESHVFMSIKKLLKIEYSAPYIVRLLVKVNSSDVMEKNDLIELIQALLKKEGLYADHINDLLSVEKISDEINLYEIVCDEVIEKNLKFENMRSIFKNPKHVKSIIGVLIKKANQTEKKDKIVELTKEIVKLTNSIADELYRIGEYDNALETLFDKTNLINSKLIESKDILLLCAQYIEARIKNQLGINEQNIVTRKKHHEDAFGILDSIIKRPADFEDHSKPYRILFLAEKAHTQHLLTEYDQAYDACTFLYKEIRNYVLELLIDLPLKMDDKEYRDIMNSKKYRNLLTFSDEAQKYLDIVSIKSLQAYIRSEQEKYKEALSAFKEVYNYRRRAKDKYTIRSMLNIAFNCGKLGWVEQKHNKDFASQCYHEGLLMNYKAYEMNSKISFPHTSHTKDMKNIILALFNIAKFNHHYDKEKNEKKYYEKAGEMYQKILVIEKAFFGDLNEYTLKAKHYLARLQNDFGSHYFRRSNIEPAKKCHEEALKLFVEVYEIQTNSLGEDHEDTLNSRKNIAFTHTIIGQVEKSFEHYDEALEIYDSLRKREWKSKDQSQNSHDSTKRQFAGLKNDFGLHEEALKLFNEVYESRKTKLGEEHEETLFATKDIAFTHTKLGQVKKSLAHYDKALEIYDSLSKKEWKSKDQCQNFYENTKRKFASLKNDFGLHEEALKLFYEIYESQKTKLGEEHERTLFARKDIAFTHNKLGRDMKSLEHYDKALEIYDYLREKDWKYKNQSRNSHEETLYLRRNIGRKY